ncbi:MAG TPA: hypothetical protein VKB76_00300 [Ktedonobacterales bacterium]|nr:hypothetical protein [Ktedonobacterales bacterium]
MTDLAPVAGKLAKLIRLLGSNRPGEVAATVEALNRTLQTIGADIHDVAERIEHSGNGALSEHEMQEIYTAGLSEGARLAVQKMRAQMPHGPPSFGAPQFPSATDMALYCYQRLDRCNEWETEFATNMASWTRRRPLTVKQQARLEELFIKLGGKLTT